MSNLSLAAIPLVSSPPGGKPYEITKIEYDCHMLTVDAESGASRIKVVFDSPMGFRVLDEGDLLEFWPTCSADNGWLYEITQGGWLSLETTRDGFLLADRHDVREFFLAGENECVSVLAVERPVIKADEL